MHPRALFTAAVIVTLSGTAQASRELEDAAQLTRELEGDVAKLEPGDLPAGKAAAAKFARAFEAINGVQSFEKSTQSYQDSLNRIRPLQPKLGAFLQGECRKLVDEVESAVPGLKPKDAEASNALIEKNIEAGDWLAAAGRVLGGTQELVALQNRYKANDANVRARFAEGSPAAPDDGLDLDHSLTAQLNSIELKYWKDFAARYADYVAYLRGGDLRRSDISAVAGMADSIGNRKAVAYAKQKIAAFTERRNALIDAQNKQAAAQREQDTKDGAEINAKMAELVEYLGGLDHYGRLQFDAEFKEPINARTARDWVQKVKDWRELQTMGAAMMKQVKVDYPRYAGDRAVNDMEKFFASCMAGDLEAAVEGCTRKFTLKAPYKSENCQCLPTGKFNQGPCTELAKALCTNDSKKAGDAVAALEVIYRELLNEKMPADVTKYGAAIEARVLAAKAASAAAYEAARMPKSNGTAPDKAKGIIVKRYPKADIVRLVVSYGPARETKQRTSTSSAGAPPGYVWVTKYNVSYSQMQATAAERIGGDLRMVWYDMYDDGKGWYVGSRNVGARIKPEHVDK